MDCMDSIGLDGLNALDWMRKGLFIRKRHGTIRNDTKRHAFQRDFPFHGVSLPYPISTISYSILSHLSSTYLSIYHEYIIRAGLVQYTNSQRTGMGHSTRGSGKERKGREVPLLHRRNNPSCASVFMFLLLLLLLLLHHHQAM